MPSKKRQHYVPKFYLRNFSINSSGKALNIYLKPTKRIVREASIKNQAYKDYFYGKDHKIENALQVVEDKAALVINKIVEHKEFPKRSSKEHNVLLTFTIFQAFRTEYVANLLNKTFDKIVKNIMQHDPILRDKTTQVRIGIHDPVRISLKIAAIHYPLVCDLEFKFLVNKTKIPFITSDHPVILYNQLMEKVRDFSPHTGLACKGLEIFLPLDPRIAVVFYDETVYSVGRRRDRSADIEDEYSINRLNELQFINAYEHVYYGNNIFDNYIEELNNKCGILKLDKEVKIQEFIPKQIEGNQYSTLLWTQQPTIRIGFKISPLVFTLKGKQFKRGPKAVYVRDEEVSDLHENFMKLADRGVYKYSQFKQYLSDLKV